MRIFPTPVPGCLHPTSLGATRSQGHSIPSGYLFSPVSGSLKSGKVIVLSCRLSAMVLSKRLLPRPESLQNTATNISHLKGGRGGNKINQYQLLKCVFAVLQHLSIDYKASCFLLGLGWDSFQHSIPQTRLKPHPQTLANFSLS